VRRRQCLGLLGACAASAALATPDAPSQAQQGPGVPPLGSRLVLPQLTRVDGRTISADHWRGRLVVIELWASWCPICANLNPHLDALHRRHRDRGLEVVGLSIDRDADLVRRYMAERRYQFNAAMFDAQWQQAIGQPRGLPVLWVVDRDSRLVRVEIGEVFPEDIEDLGKLV
jgi:thiol-disulfide isomerase/thioredoxin